MHRFLVVVETANGHYSASAPDLPGCSATGHSLDDTRRNMRKAIERHLRGLQQEERPIPTSSSFAVIVEVAAASPD